MDQEISQQSDTSSPYALGLQPSKKKSFIPIFLISGLLIFIILATIAYFLTINKNVSTPNLSYISVNPKELSAIDKIRKNNVNNVHAMIKQYYVENGSYPKDLNELITLFNIKDEVKTMSNPPYYFSSNGKTYEYYIKLENGEMFKGDIKGINEWLDGHVRAYVDQIAFIITEYNDETKRLPKSLEEATSIPRTSYFKLTKNPITAEPYIYIPNSAGTGFTLIGKRSDGNDYIMKNGSDYKSE